MKKCAICGQRTERGSFCSDCRAALKRARDETVSQFQMRPAMALAGAGARLQRASPRRPKEPPRPQIARAAEPVAENVAATDAAAASFVWIIVALMVMVVAYVGYRLLEATVDAPELPVVTAPPAASETLAAPVARETQLGLGAQEVSTDMAKRVGVAPPVPVDPSLEPRVAVAPIHPRPAPKPSGALAVRELPGSARSRPNPAATPRAGSETSSVADAVQPEPVVAAKAGASPAAGEPLSPGKWERMDLALRACANESLLGAVICEQKVRWQYCGRVWGQVPQCPGSPSREQDP
ncbi:MAG: hypothetical protein ABJC33_07370 [Betaproteobacteria bacterium]